MTIRMPAYTDGAHEFFHALLTSALVQAGHLPTIEHLVDYPNLRERKMLKNGDVDVLWLIHSKERDEQYLPVSVNLTNGLIGQRILLVPPRNLNNFRGVKTVDDFRELDKAGGFGKDWFDTRVWETNNLRYCEIVNWRLLFNMVADGSRNVDYFSRGFNEVLRDAKDHPNLAIEPHLMLVYDRDYRFYVSPKAPHIAPIIEDALTKARKSGLMNEIIKEHWAKNFDILQPEKRTIIKLKSPE